MLALRSSTPSYTQRNAPAVKRELPPISSLGASSTISTLAPFSAAACAAQNAAFPAPTTTTSYFATGPLRYAPPRLSGRRPLVLDPNYLVLNQVIERPLWP